MFLKFPWICFRFDDEFTANDLKNFVRQKTGIYLPLPGCLEDFDILADKLMTTSDAGKNIELIHEHINRYLQCVPYGYGKCLRAIVWWFLIL